MGDHGCLYMLTGNKHGPVLAVSIHSLRKSGYRGPVHIAVGDDAAQAIAVHIFADERLGPVSFKRWRPPSDGRNAGYLAKTWMDTLTPFDRTLFLDADTLVAGPLDMLFGFPSPVVLTQFADWTSNGRKISGRIRPWGDVAPDDVREMLAKPYPAINTGVICFDRSLGSSRFFEDWRTLTAKRVCFICDELSAQLIFWRHAVAVGGSEWNCSPLKDRRQDAVIWHFHGKKHVNQEKGRRIWLPAYDECVRGNVARIAEWTPASDRRLREFLDSRAQSGAA